MNVVHLSLQIKNNWHDALTSYINNSLVHIFISLYINQDKNPTKNSGILYNVVFDLTILVLML